MITHLYLNSFKSFLHTNMPISSFSLLIGSNASGKSNALEALWILSEIASGKKISTILDGTRNMGSIIRGGSIGCPRIPGNEFEIGVTLSIEDYSLDYIICICVNETVQVTKEKLIRKRKCSEETIFENIGFDKDLGKAIIRCISDKYDDYQQDMYVDSFSSALSQVTGVMPTTNSILTQNRNDAYKVISELEKTFFLQANPKAMRGYARISDRKMFPDGGNVSSVLYELQQKTNYMKDILAVIDDLPENGINEIGFIKTEANDVMLTVREKDTEGDIDARSLSDGTLRCLAILAAVYSEAEGSIIALEEIDNGIHPSRINKIFEALQRIADERNLIIIATTHNPVVMDSVNKAHMGGILLCYREAESGASCVKRYVDLPCFYRLAAKGTVGELATGDEFSKAMKRENWDKMTDLSWLRGEL